MLTIRHVMQSSQFRGNKWILLEPIHAITLVKRISNLTAGDQNI